MTDFLPYGGRSFNPYKEKNHRKTTGLPAVSKTIEAKWNINGVLFVCSSSRKKLLNIESTFILQHQDENSSQNSTRDKETIKLDSKDSNSCDCDSDSSSKPICNSSIDFDHADTIGSNVNVTPGKLKIVMIPLN